MTPATTSSPSPGRCARRALTALEATAAERRRRTRGPVVELGVADVEAAIDQAAVRYDRNGDQHYDVTSAFIKSIRGPTLTPHCTTWRG